MDPLMAEAVCGVARKTLPWDVFLPAAAQLWQPMQAALYVLSGGIFDPQRDGRGPLPNQRNERLISVVCPSCETRHHFHPLLYECFQSQDYEPRELVVVDTGARPSRFFQEKAKED